MPTGVADWLADLGKNLPAPTPDMDPAEGEAHHQRAKERELSAVIPGRFQWARLDAPELTERAPMAAAQLQSLRAPPRELVIAGPGGSGKTSLACALLWRWLDLHGQVPALTTSFALANAGIQHRAGHGEADLIRTAKIAPLLLIDDVGQEEKTPSSALKEVVWHRHAHMLATWYTTGFKSPALLEKYGAGFVRRMSEGRTVSLY